MFSEELWCGLPTAVRLTGARVDFWAAAILSRWNRDGRRAPLHGATATKAIDMKWRATVNHGQQRANEATDAVDIDHVERVIVASAAAPHR